MSPKVPLCRWSIASISARAERLCVPCCTMRRYFSAARTSWRPSHRLCEHGFVDIAERGNLDVRDARKGVEVILPATPETADGDAHAVVGAEDALRASEKREAGEGARARGRLCGGFEEVPSRHI